LAQAITLRAVGACEPTCPPLLQSSYLVATASGTNSDIFTKTVSAEVRGIYPVKRTLLIVSILVLAIFCALGAVWTVYWSLRFGLAPRPPLSLLQTVVRFAAVAFALILLLYRRDWIERAALFSAIIAAGSSALFGLGFRSTTLDFIRLLFHFVAYALGFAASVRWLIRQVRSRQPSFVVR
jgi:hypothetical protein